MGIRNLYSNLPGHLVEFKDGGSQLSNETTVEGSKSLLILGTAIDGPINEPVKIDKNTVTQLFGSDVNEKGYPNGTTLTKYAKQAFKNGFQDVRCMRVTGSQAFVDVTKGVEVTSTAINATMKDTIPGNSEFTIEIDKVDGKVPIPMIDGTISVLTENGSRCSITYDLYNPELYVDKNVAPINSTYNYSFEYKDVSQKVNDYTVSNDNTMNVFNVVDGEEKLYEVDKRSDGTLLSGVTKVSNAYFVKPSDTSVLSTTDIKFIDSTGTDITSKVIATEDSNKILMDGIMVFCTDSTINNYTFMLKEGTHYTIGRDTNGNPIVKLSLTDINTSIKVGEIPNASPIVPTVNAGIDASDTTADNSINAEINNALTISITGIDSNTITSATTTNSDVSVSVNATDDTKIDITPTSELIDESITITLGLSDSSTKDVSLKLTAKSNDPTEVFLTNNTTVTIVRNVYNKIRVDGNYTQNDGEDKVIELEFKPVINSVNVSIKGTDVDASNIEVNDKQVKIKSSAFSNYIVNEEIVVNYKYEDTETREKKFTVQSLYGGSVYKEAKLTIDKETKDGVEYKKFIFTKPNSKLYSNADKPFSFTSLDCPTVGDLKTALENYTLNNVFDIIYDDDTIPTNIFDTGVYTLNNGGDDGINPTPNEMYIALSGERNSDGLLTKLGAYQILENYNVDYVYPAGVYADMKQTINPYSDFHQELALFCAVLTYRTKMTHGFIDVKPNNNTSLVGIDKYVSNLLKYPNIHYMRDDEGNDIIGSDGNKMDIGWYTSVVVGPEPIMMSDTLGKYYGSPAIAYAGLNANLKPEVSPMNKALINTRGIKYKFSNKQTDALIGNRYVTFKTKNEGMTTATSTPYVVDAMTAGNPNCDYRRMTTVKIVTDVVDQIREVSDPYIGEPNTVEKRNSLATQISKRLSYLIETGEILHYGFDINATVQQVLIGECTISLELVCPMELRTIRTIVSLRSAV